MEKLALSINENDDEHVDFIEEDNIGSSDEEDEGKHSQMIDAVRTLSGKKRLPTTQRSEASLTVSEFSLCHSASDKLKLGDLLSSLGKTSSLAKLKRNVNKTKKLSKVLPPPLAKPEAEKIKRSLAYQRACKDVSKWDNIVEQNRRADHQSFPLKHTRLTLEPISEVVKRFKVLTPLEQEMTALLQEVQPQDDDAQSEQNSVQFLNFDEAMDMRQTMRRLRAQQATQEAKFRRRNKIKSKSYHRILRREKLKKEMKEFEELQKTNPELAAEKLEELDRQRALERVSLRHRNTGKWAKYQMLRTKHNKESGQAIQEQIELSRALTAKKFIPSDSDDELLSSEDDKETRDAVCDASMEIFQKDSFNPWMTNEVSRKMPRKAGTPTTVKSKAQQVEVGYRSYWDNENKKRLIEKSRQKANENASENIAVSRNDELESDVGKTVVRAHVSDSSSISKLSLNSASVKEPVEFSDDDESDLSDSARQHSAAKLDEVDKLFKLAKEKQKLNNKHQKLASTSSKVTMLKANKTERDIETFDPAAAGDMGASYMSETLDRKQTLEDFENLPPEELHKSFIPPGDSISLSVTNDSENKGKLQESDVVIDPLNFITVKEKVIKSRVPQVADYDEDALDDGDDPDDDGQHKINIVEAFADDDVIEEFKLEKQAVIERDIPKDIDLTLPGWGEWGGEGVPTRSKKRFIKKAPPAPARRDSAIGNVIINEKADEKLKPHLVTQIPFAFHSKRQFEASVQAPLGKQWNPETVFRRTIAPKVSTKKGTIIDPMDADAITENCAQQTKFKRPTKSELP